MSVYFFEVVLVFGVSKWAPSLKQNSNMPQPTYPQIRPSGMAAVYLH